MSDFPKLQDYPNDKRIVKTDTGFEFTDTDNITYEYVASKSAWMPILSNIYSIQQSVYSVQGVDESIEPRKRKKKKDPMPDKKVRPNSAVFVQNLPLDATIQEIHEYFSKCGIILNDTLTNTYKIKMYCDESDRFKGEALVVYYKPESLNMAVNLLDDTVFRMGHSNIKVSPVYFSS